MYKTKEDFRRATIGGSQNREKAEAVKETALNEWREAAQSWDLAQRTVLFKCSLVTLI